MMRDQEGGLHDHGGFRAAGHRKGSVIMVLARVRQGAGVLCDFAVLRWPVRWGNRCAVGALVS
jgi:hypothetical protein